MEGDIRTWIGTRREGERKERQSGEGRVGEGKSRAI